MKRPWIVVGRLPWDREPRCGELVDSVTEVYEREVLGTCRVEMRVRTILQWPVAVSAIKVWQVEPAATPEPPRLGELLVCLAVPLDRQKDRLGDFEELFTTLWLPKFGPRLARLVYLAHAVRAVSAIVKFTIAAAIVDRVMRAAGL